MFNNLSYKKNKTRNYEMKYMMLSGENLSLNKLTVR